MFPVLSEPGLFMCGTEMIWVLKMEKELTEVLVKFQG